MMLFRKNNDAVSHVEEPEPAQEIDPTVTVTVIAPGTLFKGALTGEDTLRIAGTVQGDIDCQQLVWVDQGGCVNGNVTAHDVIIEGEVNGDIKSSKRVEIRSKGRLAGNIIASNITVDQGCFFDGEARITR